jgi:hypothetical protein
MSNNYYKLKKTPNGHSLFTYMAAILEVTGMDKGNVFPLKKFLGNFSTHVSEGRIVKTEGGWKLSKKGIDYFQDRYNQGNPQYIIRSEVEFMIKGIQTGKVSGEWEELTI